MAAQRRKIQSSAARRRRSAWFWWAWGGGLGLVAIVVVGLMGSVIWGLQERVRALPEVQDSHQFMVNHQAGWQRLLLLGIGEQGQVRQAAVLSYGDGPQSVGIIRLPENLSLGQAILSDYLKNGYYGELQQVVEQQIGLPLTGYVIESLQEGRDRQWLTYLSGKKAIGWLDSTVGLPFWLSGFGSVETSLPWGQFLGVVQLVREATVGQGEIAVDLPVEAILWQGERAVILEESLTDKVLRPVYKRASYAEEGMTVEVKNATNVSGLAAMMGRYVTNLGGEVVATVAADTPASRSALTAEVDSSLGQELSQYLGIPLEVKSRTGRERAKMELVLGADVLGRIGR